jgi:hypothetical protein
MGLIVEQADAPGKAVLAQRCGDLKARMAGADNQDRSLGHRDSPAGRAQGLPMSSPIIVDFGACSPHPE